MSGGRFLNNLREVLNSKRILRCRSLIKENKVTTEYVAEKLITRSLCESYKILLKACQLSRLGFNFAKITVNIFFNNKHWF